jgi:HAD superfamily hydrolase (TIGR01484 family)
MKGILMQVMNLRAFQPPQKLKHRSMPLILYNGALIISSDGRTLYKKWEIDKTSSVNIIGTALKYRLRPLIYCVNYEFLLGLEEKVFSVLRGDDESKMFDFNGLAIKNIAQSMISEIESPVAILLYGASSISPFDVSDMLVDIRDSANANLFGDRVEITPKDANKGVALVELADILDWDIDHVMVVGDSSNDIAMMRVAGIGVALANSPPEVREMSDYVTDLSYTRGVNEAILKGVIRGDWKVKPKCRT